MNFQQNKQLKMKFYINGSKIESEELFVIDTKTKEITYDIFSTFEVGNIIVSIVNSYNEINRLLDTYIAKINKTTPSSLDKITDIFQKMSKKLKTKGFSILSELLDINFYNLHTRIENTIKYDIFSDDEYKKYQGNIQHLYLRKPGFAKYAIIKFLNEFKQSLVDMKKLTENTFNINSNKNDIDYYSKLSAELPRMSIEYIENIKSGIQSYTYDINTIEDLFISGIYNLHLSNKFILKCQYCGNLFIPKTNKKTQKYCYAVDENEEYTCRNKGRKNMYYKRTKEN